MTPTESVRPGIIERTFREFGIRNLLSQTLSGRIIHAFSTQIETGETAKTEWLYLLVPPTIGLNELERIVWDSFQGAFTCHVIGQDGEKKRSFYPEERWVDSYTHTQVRQRLEQAKEQKA